jgi:hypothetical protein
MTVSEKDVYQPLTSGFLKPRRPEQMSSGADCEAFAPADGTQPGDLFFSK